MQTDISNEEQIKQMVAQTLAEYGQIDILVNNSANAAVVRNKSVQVGIAFTPDFEEPRSVQDDPLSKPIISFTRHVFASELA
jgi:NAD(P)-dependent dehydrogenase (short-subunit alcohol dehydrogenase family)